MGESFWSTTHLEMFFGVSGIVVSSLTVIWIDLRNQSRKNREAVMQNQVQTEKRFTKLETMIEPLWDWFTNGRK